MEIFLFDEFSPQTVAMLQALYSRSAQSVQVHAEAAREDKSGKFMEKFYVGYGHKSIGDCGSTTIFIEGVSMLCAKAIQDWQLYSGQETSSRYIDMSKQKIEDPIRTEASTAILQKWMQFYTEEQSAVEAHLREKYLLKPGEKEDTYDKAIKARVFDILRGFLPAGATTQLSWHTNLRQAADKLALLIHHPLAEVRAVAESILTELKGKYSESFGHKKYQEQEVYRDMMMRNHAYYNETDFGVNEFFVMTSIDPKELYSYTQAIKERPKITELPTFLEELGAITFSFALDFGSFRDIQRQRNGVCRMPLLGTKLGFNEWYLEQLPAESREKAEKLIAEQTEAIQKIDASAEIKQYYIAMGFNVWCKVTYGLPAAVYVTELRAGKLVHPTLRKVAHKMYEAIHDYFPELVLHTDLDPDDWDIRRGLQDIVKK